MNKKMFKLKYFAIISTVMIATIYQLVTPTFAKAADPRQSLSISPVINDLQLTPGKKTTFIISIRNNNNSSIGIHAETTGYDVTGEESIFEQKPSAMTQWTTLSKNDLLIDPKQTNTITVTIDTPKNIHQSGYYESIFLTPIGHQQEYANSPIILSRFGVLVLGTVGKLNYSDLSKKVTIDEVSPSYEMLETNPQDISFSVANSYFTHFDAKPFITITPLFANSQTVQLTDKHILPGSKRIWHYQPTVEKNHILYNVHLAVSIGGGNQIFADTWYLVLPYKLILLTIIVLLLLYITISKRKRLGKFVTILLKG